MKTKTITWEPYLKAGTGSRTLTGCFVTLTPAGSMSISKELTADVAASARWMRVEYAASVKKIRLTPIEQGMPGSLRMQKPGERRSKGAQVRLGSGAGLKAWGLVPKVSARYCASWQGESIIVDLTKPFDANDPVPEASPIPAAKPLVDASSPASAPMDDSGSGQEAQDVVGDGTQLPPCCRNCADGTELKGRPQRLCDSRDGPNKRKLMPGTGLCGGYRPRKPIPPDRSIQAGLENKRDCHHSNPRGTCPECGTEHAVTASGLFPHDADGVDYRGGRGDHSRCCPGSGRRPGVDA
jgi:hypothetical protein